MEIRNSVICFILFLFLLFSAKTIFAADTSDIVKTLDSTIRKLDNFWIDFENNNNNTDYLFNLIVTEVPNINSQIGQSIVFFDEQKKTADEPLTEILDNFILNLNGIKNSLDELVMSITTGTDDDYNKALDDYDYYMGQLNLFVNKINDYTGASTYTVLLPILFWITLIISLYFFIITRDKPFLPSEKLRNEYQKTLFKASLWPFGGSAISYFWMLSTPAGETYYLLWWPILIGGFYFLRGLYIYIRYSRPALNLARNEQQSKLANLLESEEFKNSNAKQKLEEIKELSPVIKYKKKK